MNRFAYTKKTLNSDKRNVLTLGLVAFFGSLSQDMIFSVLPSFYTQVLGLQKETIGLIEGSMATLVSILKFVSGVISDKLGKRKPVIFIGYLLSAIGRILLVLINTPLNALGTRLLDGIGKGIKDAPRDAILAKSCTKRQVGRLFGLQKTLDTLGSFIGPLITSYLLIKYKTSSKSINYRLIFLIAGLISFITIILVKNFVSESNEKAVVKCTKIDSSIFKGKFMVFFVVMLIFTLGNSSDTFLILKAEDIGIKPITIPLVIAEFNLFYTLFSIPNGMLSDKIGRVNVIRLGWLLYAITYLGFACARFQWEIWGLYAIYGIYYSTTEGIAKSLVAQSVNEKNRGAAFGLYSASIGLLSIPASTIAGILWDKVSSSAPFYFSTIWTIFAIILISVVEIE